MEPHKRSITIDIQVIAYLGDYLNLYKKSLDRRIRVNIQMPHEPVQTAPVNIASSRNLS